MVQNLRMWAITLSNTLLEYVLHYFYQIDAMLREHNIYIKIISDSSIPLSPKIQ